MIQFRMQQLHRKKIRYIFLGISLDLKTINQGGVQIINGVLFFISGAKIKLLYRLTKQKVKMLIFANYYIPLKIETFLRTAFSDHFLFQEVRTLLKL